MEAQVAADEPRARTVRQPRAHQELRRVERARRDDDGPRVDAPERAFRVDVLDAFRLPVLHDDPLDRGLGAQLEPPGRPGVVDVGVHRRLAGVRRAALQAGAAAHAVRVRVRVHGLEMRAERAEAGLDRVDALAPVRSNADAEPLLDAFVVRAEVATRRTARRRQPTSTARLVPLRVVVVVDAQRDLRVDRRRPADAPGGEERDDPAGAAVDRREPQRPPEVVVRLRLPAREVGGGAVRARLQEQHAAAAVGELPGDDAAAGARADHDDVEPLARAHPASGAAPMPIPRYDQSFAGASRAGSRSRSPPRRPARRRPARRSRCRTPRSRAPAPTRTPAWRRGRRSPPPRPSRTPRSQRHASPRPSARAAHRRRPPAERAPSRARSHRRPGRTVRAVPASSTWRAEPLTGRLYDAPPVATPAFSRRSRAPSRRR